MRAHVTKVLLALGILSLVYCAAVIKITPPGTVVVYAQTVPATVHATWTPRPASENVVSYKITLDGTAIAVPLSSCTATLCTATLTIPAFGAHVTAVLGQNYRISADPTTIQDGAATTINWTLNQSPNAVQGAAIAN